MYSSTFFRASSRPSSGAQQLHHYTIQINQPTRRKNFSSLLLDVGRGRAGRPDHDQQHRYHHAPTVKPEAATAVVVAPHDGREDVRNMLSRT